MANFPERNLSQTCVYWGSPTSDGYGGFTFAEPEEISCRWMDTTQVITDAKGQQIVCRAKVQVAQDLDLDGMLYLGTLDDLDSAEQDAPHTILGAYIIKRFDKTPTLTGGKFVRKAYL